MIDLPRSYFGMRRSFAGNRPTLVFEMRCYRLLSSAVIVVAIVGCAAQQPRPGIPVWDYARDEQDDQIRSAIAGAILGGVLGAMTGGRATGTGIGAVLQVGIDLTPSELNVLIQETLAPQESGTSLRATSGAASASEAARIQWTISDSNEGQITTDWKRIAGRKAGILWWQKEYETEVRHVITIKQSADSPRVASFSILTEVRERPNENYPWAPADPELGRESFERIKNVVLAAVRTEIFKRKAQK